MTLTRRLSLVAVIFAVSAGGCGGGGSATFPPLTSAEAQALIEDCGLPSDLAQFAAVLDFLQNLLGAGGEAPAVDVSVVNVITFLIGWSVDLDNDGTADVTGTLQFRDQLGRPTLPVDPNNPPDINTIQEALALLDGHTVQVTFEIPNLSLLTGNTGSGSGMIDFGVDGGLITNASGRATLAAGGCTFEVSFDDVTDFDPEVDGFPIAALDFALFGNGRRLDGTVDLDGTNIANLHANVDTGTDLYQIDLATGTILP